MTTPTTLTLEEMSAIVHEYGELVSRSHLVSDAVGMKASILSAVSARDAEIKRLREALTEADAGLVLAPCGCSGEFRCSPCKAKTIVADALGDRKRPKCPRCGSGDTTTAKMDGDDPYYNGEWTCNACDHDWRAALAPVTQNKQEAKTP